MMFSMVAMIGIGVLVIGVVAVTAVLMNRGK